MYTVSIKHIEGTIPRRTELFSEKSQGALFLRQL